MTQRAVVTTIYTRPNTSFPWHETSISDPALSTMHDQIVDFRWENYTGMKSVMRGNPDDLTFVVIFNWFDKATYDAYKALATTQAYEPALAAYYEANGGSVSETVEFIEYN